VSQSFPTCRSIASDRLVAEIVEYHLPDLIADLLPVVNEVASLFSAHYLGTLVFEDGDDRFRIGALAGILSIGN
jgi:hypothetical protein